MKQAPKAYRGIEYVMLGELPSDQQMLIRSLPFLEIFKILFADGSLAENCIQFRTYEAWYDREYAAHLAALGAVEPLRVPVVGDQSQIPLSGTISNTLPSGSSK